MINFVKKGVQSVTMKIFVMVAATGATFTKAGVFGRKEVVVLAVTRRIL